MSQLEECPVCNASLPSNEKHREENEAHVAACIEGRLANQLSLKEATASEGQCPVCHTPFPSKGLGSTQRDREAHVTECMEASENAPRKGLAAPPGYDQNEQRAGEKSVRNDAKESKGKLGKERIGALRKDDYPVASSSKLEKDALSKQATNVDQVNAGRRPSLFQRLTSSLGRDTKTPEEKTEAIEAKADSLMLQRWGPPGSTHHQLVMRYWVATRMQQHWEYLRSEHPRRFRKKMESGYMEPIPTRWVQDRRMAYPYPDFSTYENAAEERLYYLLNHGVMPDGSQHPPLGRPLNVNRDMYLILKRGNERNARQVPLPDTLLAAYRSPGDVFHSDRRIKSQDYSYQVPNVVYGARRAALHELADGIIHGTDHLETMLLIDTSSSMTWNPHDGMPGPDGIRRFHDQPANIRLTEHLVHRVLHHMIPRAQREHPHQRGIDTVTFASYGNYVGELSAQNFRADWHNKIGMRLGGGTQVMQGWQMVKNTYFQHQHANYGHGRLDPVFGWQPTPGMPKLSLLVFLDGEAMDMDEFELELLGETWAYVTIALVGMENCPHHHSHAIELERVARFNPHVGFFDVHGRVCERLCVKDLLESVYPVDAPAYEELLKPEFDLKPDELPAYSV